MEAYRIKFTLPNGDITIRDLAFSQTVEATGALAQDQRRAFWNHVEVDLPLSNSDRAWQGCKALFIKEV